MNELALFAGAGGGLLGSQWLLGWRTICYVEIEPYAVACLVARIKDGLLDDAPIWDDARTFDGKLWNGIVDIISAGFPCQPFSVAGKRKGAEDERNLWPDTIRIICEVQPRYILLENVPGLLADKYVRRIFGDLAQSGYDCRWRCLSAAEVGANHRRNRVWIVGWNTQGNSVNKVGTISERKNPQPKRICSDVGNTKCESRWAKSSTRLGMESNPLHQQEWGKDSNRIETSNNDVAHAQTDGWNPRLDKSKQGQKEDFTDSRNIGGSGEDVADPRCEYQGSKDKSTGSSNNLARHNGYWATEPRLGRVAHGVAHRVDRLKALGEGQVPAVVRVVWELLNNG